MCGYLVGFDSLLRLAQLHVRRRQVVIRVAKPRLQLHSLSQPARQQRLEKVRIKHVR